MSGTIEFASGAKTSEHKPRYDLVPRELMEAVAGRFEAGALKYGPGNYEKGLADPDFLRERANHMVDHMFKYLAGDWSEDSEYDALAAIGWGVAVLLQAEALGSSIHSSKTDDVAGVDYSRGWPVAKQGAPASQRSKV